MFFDLIQVDPFLSLSTTCSKVKVPQKVVSKTILMFLKWSALHLFNCVQSTVWTAWMAGVQKVHEIAENAILVWVWGASVAICTCFVFTNQFQSWQSHCTKANEIVPRCHRSLRVKKEFGVPHLKIPLSNNVKESKARSKQSTAATLSSLYTSAGLLFASFNDLTRPPWRSI